MIRWLSTDSTRDRSDIATIQSDALLIRAAASLSPIHVKCLARTLYQWRQLLKTGLETEICIGMEMGSDFHAHAWLEKNGEVLNDSLDAIEHFQVIRLVRDSSSETQVVEK